MNTHPLIDIEDNNIMRSDAWSHRMWLKECKQFSAASNRDFARRGIYCDIHRKSLRVACEEMCP